MFEPEFADGKGQRGQNSPAGPWHTALHRNRVRLVQLLYWREHCLECAPPDCYYSCPLYVPRRDKRCARFEYGIYPNKDFEGLQSFGAEIRFRKWGKLGADMHRGGLSPAVHNLIASVDRFGSSMLFLMHRITAPVNLVDLLGIKFTNPQRTIFKAYAVLRSALLQLWPPAKLDRGYDSFVVECFSYEKDTFNLILEYKESEVKSRHALPVKQGPNYHEIKVAQFNGRTNPLRGSLNVYPENDKEVRVVFTWLDFVQKFKEAPRPEPVATDKPAEKIKCLVWDLDNTLWKGVLIEDGKNAVVLRNEAIDLMRKLDERGIIQSVISKNDQAEALETLARFGLTEYFVYPMINWDPKSDNMKRLAAALNINVDTLALIDDSPFERAEVKSVLPQCRVYGDDEIVRLLDYPEVDAPVTEESKLRRLSYLAEMEREKTFENCGGDYESFLRSCKMELRIFIPKEEAQITRCLELIQRSNQLNLSTKRYSDAEFRGLLHQEGMVCVAFQCKDRFGDYGIVGFSSVHEAGEAPQLVDLVISCRVAQKMVERTFIEWLVERERAKGYRMLNAELAKTKRNGPLRSVFESLPFEVVEEDEKLVRMRLPFEKVQGRNTVVHANIDV